MENLIANHLDEIKRLLISHNVEKAYLFGSAARGEMDLKSDIDFLIRFSSNTDINTYAENYFNLMYSLQDLLNREVDLVEETTLTNPYLIESINNNKMLLL